MTLPQADVHADHEDHSEDTTQSRVEFTLGDGDSVDVAVGEGDTDTVSENDADSVGVRLTAAVSDKDALTELETVRVDV